MTRRKRFLIAIGLLWGLPLALALALGFWVAQAGTIVVSVDERGPGGDHVHLKLPAAMVQVVLGFLPSPLCVDAGAEMERWGPCVRAACSELVRCPDGVLVEATGPGESVRIAKSKRQIIIDVESNAETVHVAVPIRTVSAVLSKFESAGWHRSGLGCRPLRIGRNLRVHATGV